MVTDEPGEGEPDFPVKDPGEPGDRPATFRFTFDDSGVYLEGSAAMGEDQAHIIAGMLAGSFGVGLLEQVVAELRDSDDPPPDS